MVSACRTEVRYHFSLRVHPFTARSFQHKFVPSRAEHSHRSVTYCSPANETADHTGGSRDHGWPHIHSIGLKGCDHTWTTGHPADGRTSHGGTHVRFKQSRITQARSGAQRVASQTQPLPTCGHVHIHHCAALFKWVSRRREITRASATCRTRHSHRSTRGHTVFMMMVTAIIVSAEARPSPGPHSSPYRSHHCPALRRRTSDMASLRLTSVSNCQSQKHGLLTTGLFIGNVAIHTNRFAPSASVFCLVFHHAGRCVALHKRVTIADQTGSSRDHGWPQNHFSRVQGLRSHP